MKQVSRHLARWMDIAHAMIELTKPIPKFPPGTIHPGGPAFIKDSRPELVVGADRMAFVVARESIMPLPNCSVMPHGLLNHSLRMSVADVRKIISEQNMPDLIAKAAGNGMKNIKPTLQEPDAKPDQSQRASAKGAGFDSL